MRVMAAKKNNRSISPCLSRFCYSKPMLSFAIPLRSPPSRSLRLEASSAQMMRALCVHDAIQALRWPCTLTRPCLALIGQEQRGLRFAGGAGCRPASGRPPPFCLGALAFRFGAGAGWRPACTRPRRNTSNCCSNVEVALLCCRGWVSPRLRSADPLRFCTGTPLALLHFLPVDCVMKMVG